MPPRGETTTFRAGPLATFADCKALEAWVAAAAVGDTTIYATGPALPHSHPTVKLITVLTDRGVVAPHLKARGDGRGFDFIARKRAAPVAIGARVDRPAASELRCATVLAALTERAVAGGVMHSNAELARACGLKNADEASYQLRKLIARGAIRIEDFGPNERRRVTIAASGQSTMRGRL